MWRQCQYWWSLISTLDQNESMAHSLQLHHNERNGVSITSVSIVCLTFCLCVDQRKHQSSASLAFVRGIYRWQVNSHHKGSVTRKCFHLMTSSYFTGNFYPTNSLVEIFSHWNHISVDNIGKRLVYVVTLDMFHFDRSVVIWIRLTFIFSCNVGARNKVVKWARVDKDAENKAWLHLFAEISESNLYSDDVNVSIEIMIISYCFVQFGACAKLISCWLIDWTVLLCHFLTQ